MKKLISYILCLMVAFCAQAQLKISDKGIIKISDVTTDVGEGLGNANNFSRHVEWPSYQGNQVLVRVQFVGVPESDIRSLNIVSDPLDPIRTELRKIDGMNEYWIFVPTEDKWIELTHTKLGVARISLPVKMKNKETYVVEAGVTRSVDITVEPLTDYNRPMRVELDGYEIKETPATFTNVIEGKHTLGFRDGNKIITRDIMVTALNNRFSGSSNKDFDFRHSKLIKVISQDKDAKIYVDGVKVSNTATADLSLTYGPHTIEAVLPSGQKDTKNIDVKGETLSIIYLDPVGLKEFEVVGLYGGRQVSAPLSVSGLPSVYRTPDLDKTQQSYKMRLPVGSSYIFRMNYAGSSGQKQIKVTQDMDPAQQIVIRGRKEFRYPWDIEMPERFVGFTFGYITKQLVTTGEGICIKTNGVWNQSWNKWLKGIQLGLNVQPQTSWGLGLYSGIFLNTYASKDSEGYEGAYKTLDEYLEFEFSLPIHLWYQVPFAEGFAFAVHGGMSFAYSVYGEFNSSFLNSIAEAFKHASEEDYDYQSEEESYSDFWGDTGFPTRFNMMMDVGLKLRVKNLLFGIQWSKGLNNHKTFSEYGDFKTVQNRRTFSVAINF